MRAVAALLAFLGLSGPALADCTLREFDGARFTACRIDPATEDLRLFLRGDDGEILGTFERVNAMLAPAGETLGIAINGGMYHEDRRPVGHYIEFGQEAMRVVTTAGPGNFGMLPNGVLCLTDGSARIIESRAYAAERPNCVHATQSGPLLVIENALHPRFNPNGTSRYIRNGVGVAPDGSLWFAISDQPVTLHHFARFFRDDLGTPDALYIDGNVSRLYAPEIGRHDLGFPMGPILGTVVPSD